MIDERSQDGTGWARFSADRTMRYRLARALTPLGLASLIGGDWIGCNRYVFVLLNPSTADAFKPDRTISRCVGFAQRWGADVLEVVNLFSLISPHPTDVWAASDRGDGPANDAQILDACRGAARVIAGWGLGGRFLERDNDVCSMLAGHGIQLYHIGLSSSGHPKHPAARGRHRIPDDIQPAPWP